MVIIHVLCKNIQRSEPRWKKGGEVSLITGTSNYLLTVVLSTSIRDVIYTSVYFIRTFLPKYFKSTSMKKLPKIWSIGYKYLVSDIPYVCFETLPFGSS